MRTMNEHILEECNARGIDIVCTCFDGQWIKLATRDVDERPLTLLQLQRDVYETASKEKRNTILKHLSEKPIADEALEVLIESENLISCEDDVAPLDDNETTDTNEPDTTQNASVNVLEDSTVRTSFMSDDTVTEILCKFKEHQKVILTHIELNIIIELTEQYQRKAAFPIRKSWKILDKANAVSKLIGSGIQKERTVKRMVSLKESALKVVQNNTRYVPKSKLNNVYAVTLYKDSYRSWISKSPFNETTEVEGVGHVKWFSYPEVSEKRNKMERKCLDAHHLLVNLRVKKWNQQKLGCPKAVNIPRLMSTVTELHHFRSNPNDRSFKIVTTRKSVYPSPDLVEHVEDDAVSHQCDQIEEMDTSPIKISSINLRVREVSMTGLHDLTSMVVNKDPSLLSSQISSNIFCCSLHQAYEKIDRIRAHAGLIFSQLLYHKPEIPNIPHREELEKIFPKSEIEEEINWAAPSDTFPRFSQLLGCESYAYNVLLNFTVSVGGITESLSIYTIVKDLDQLLSKGSFGVLASDTR
ncbi:TBCD [Mytilus coruscus]|uniref:TBCD n=1 Tax=Mytilus coruscus TaxID=42192 RepID=A0A6J8AGD9_MYTCO|nr:TBCD [Mytilus coruscus]